MAEPSEFEVLSALLDREPVDPDVLQQVLERPAARALFVDFVRVRTALHAEPLGTMETMPSSDPARMTRVPLAMRAAAALLLLTLGALVGVWSARERVDSPPAPSRVVRLTPSTPGGQP